MPFGRSSGKAQANFVLLDEMFEALNYSLGFFVNIGTLDPILRHYGGKHRDRIIAVAAIYDNGKKMSGGHS